MTPAVCAPVRSALTCPECGYDGLPGRWRDVNVETRDSDRAIAEVVCKVCKAKSYITTD
jgi:hypothetical protein